MKNKYNTICSQGSGCDWHRIVQPMTYLTTGEECKLLWWGEDEINISCDILMYNKMCSSPIDILRIMKQNGMKIVVDIDDLPELPPQHVMYHSWQRNNSTQVVQEHMKLADVVICTSMLLQDKVREFNKNTVVIPNALPYSEYTPDPQPRDKMTFMYMGGVTHLPDVKLLEGKFKRIGSDTWIKDRAEFILAGYEKSKRERRVNYRQADGTITPGETVTEEVHDGPYDRMKNIFSYTNSYDIRPTLPLWEYMNHYDHADVALIPLEQTEWNRYKSTLKIAECGAKGIPAIVSKVEPYWPELKDAPGILWVENNDWLTPIKWCIKNLQKVKEMGHELREYCKEHYELMTWNITRKNVLDSL